MSGKYENPCATYNIPLNASENDIFRIGRVHLQHFLHLNVKMDDCKHMMLKMHLELDDSPSIGEAEQRNIVHNSSNNGLRQSVQQLEEEMKVLKDALLQAMDDVVNRTDKTPDIDNNAKQKSNSNLQAKNENKLSGEQHNDTENVASDSASAREEYHTNTMSEKKPELIDLRRNCVYIRGIQCSDSRLDKAFYNIRKLATEMDVKIPYDSIIHIHVQKTLFGLLDYYVYFSNERIKEEFLKNKNIFVYHPETNPLRILDYSNWNIVVIENVQSSDLSLKAATDYVMEIAHKMSIRWIDNHIDHIDVISVKPNVLTYSVHFDNQNIRRKFIQRAEILNDYSELSSLKISDIGGNTLTCTNVNNFSMTEASANVIGLAELIDLSLTTDNFKRICILNPIFCYCDFSLLVEFSSKQVKDEFLMKKHNLKKFKHFNHRDIHIWNSNAKKDVVSIRYENRHEANALSFIGLVKHLGFSLTLDQIHHFFHLSKFFDEAFST